MFIPNNEYASTLLDIVEQEYPTLVIPLQKFTVLIESMSDMKEGNSRFIGGADANKIRGKFKAVFGQEISKQQPSRPAKRSSNQSTEQPKKIPKVDNTATSERYSKFNKLI